MVLNQQPTDPWTRGDRKLLEAYEIYQRELCQACGKPVWLCRNDDENLQFEVRTSVCRSERAVKKWVETNRKKDGLNPGENPYAVPYYLRYTEGVIAPEQDYNTLPTREDYYKAKAEVNSSG